MRIKRLLTRISITVATALAFTMVAGMTVQATDLENADAYTGKTYTVTFHPGNVGSFTDLDDVVAIYGNQEGVVSAESTTHKAIKLVVKPGTQITAPIGIEAKDDYYYRQQWNETVEGTVTKNADYVPQFGRLIDGIEYQVKFLIKGTETSVYPPVFNRGNVGDELSFTALANIPVSAGAFYVLQGEATRNLVLDADPDNNIIVFEYVLQDRYAVTSESTLLTDGGTVTTVESVTVPGAAAPAAAGGGGAAPAAVAPAAAEEAPALTEIDNGQTALAASVPESPEEATTTIEEPETPLDANLSQTTNLPYLVLTGVLIAAIAVGFYVYTKKNPRKSDSDGE
ncbi:hypothetical protein SAMN02910368_02184 [Lachnospiraceae bacterium G11]|nr:hypothetical protein SAMN02910368_02184 [Lachnospiraceae bacterium G11]